jgi:subtilisin family serine protease
MRNVAVLNRSLNVSSLRSLDLERESIAADPLKLVELAALMERTSGRREIVIGLIDGPVAMDHPNFAGENIRGFPGNCTHPTSIACMHGTFIAGILSARRGSAAPAICPGCALLVCPIFPEANELIPSTTPEELSTAIIKCIDAGARLLNLSAVLAQSASTKGESALAEALDYAANCGVIVVAAAGNQGTVGSTVITSHPWVIAVAACDLRGRPLNESNLGSSIGRRGLSAPGEAITSLGTDGKSTPSGGTSVAAPFVTGAIALTWSEFPTATGAQIRLAVAQARGFRQATLVPPLLNAWAIYQAMTATQGELR